MNKRNPRNQNKLFNLENEDSPNSDRLLHVIQQKLEKSAALNGGFDKLLFKIDVIENNQVQMSEKVDKIHEAIYHPDDGLFARINKNKADQLDSISKLELHVLDVNSKQNLHEKSAEDFEKSHSDLKERVHKIEHHIEASKQTKAYFSSIIKWLGPAGIGGLVMLLLNFIFEHMKK
jgi:DNA anti-recombination protein RmuC